MISDKQLLAKVEAGEDLTVDEVKRYYQITKPQKQVYGKYGTLKRKYLEDVGLDWTIANRPNTYTAWTNKPRICTMFSRRNSRKIHCTSGQASLWKITAGLRLCNTPLKKKILHELIYTEEAV